MNDEYITSTKAREMLKITSETLRSWNNKEKIEKVDSYAYAFRMNLVAVKDKLEDTQLDEYDDYDNPDFSEHQQRCHFIYEIEYCY